MKPLSQTITEVGKGNCLAACVASILEVSLESVPDLQCGVNFRGLQEYLAGFNLTAIWLHCPELGSAYVGYTPEYCILIGDSPRNEKLRHAVVGRPKGYGYETVHDPHPDGYGLKGEPESVIYLGILGTIKFSEENI